MDIAQFAWLVTVVDAGRRTLPSERTRRYPKTKAITAETKVTMYMRPIFISSMGGARGRPLPHKTLAAGFHESRKSTAAQQMNPTVTDCEANFLFAYDCSPLERGLRIPAHRLSGVLSRGLSRPSLEGNMAHGAKYQVLFSPSDKILPGPMS